MKRNVISAIVVASLIGITGASAATVGFRIGDVAIGYNDGYWDNHHHWHHWRAGEMERFRHDRGTAFHDWRHDDRNHH